MRLGIINGTTDADFQSVKNQGFDFLEVCVNFDNQSEDFIADVKNIKERTQRYGIDISSVGRWNHEINVGGKINPEKEDIYMRLLYSAIELGAKTFVVGCNKDENVSMFKNYCCAVEFFGRLIDAAKGRISIAVQNCHWNNFILTPADWDIVLGELPELMIKYDCSHAYKRHMSYLDEMSDWGDRIAHFHIKGIVHAGKCPIDDPPAGMDDINWPAVFAILYARKYNGDISIEPHSPTWKGEMSEKGIMFTKEYISKFILK